MKKSERLRVWLRAGSAFVFILSSWAKPCIAAELTDDRMRSLYKSLEQQQLKGRAFFPLILTRAPRELLPFPVSQDTPAFLNMKAACQLKREAPSEALPFLYGALAQDPDNEESNQLLDEALKKLGVDPRSFDERMKHARALDVSGFSASPGYLGYRSQARENYSYGPSVEIRAALALRDDPQAQRELAKALMDNFDNSGEWMRSNVRFDFMDILTRLAKVAPGVETDELLARAEKLEAKRKDKQARLEAVDLLNSGGLTQTKKEYLHAFWRKQVKEKEGSPIRHMCLARALERSGDANGALVETNVAGLLRCQPTLLSDGPGGSDDAGRKRLYQMAAKDVILPSIEESVRLMRRQVETGNIFEERQ